METKKLSLEEMEGVEGGDKACTAAVIGMAASIIGAAVSFASLPLGGPLSAWGLGASIAGIYAGGPAIALNC
ncbi:MAG TPA: hypothetical protein VE912_06245 [Bacteroidales bacterium]|nr:hypothetical protein [Bacteroidales bacterium]